jgi:hypothetical protein
MPYHSQSSNHSRHAAGQSSNRSQGTRSCLARAPVCRPIESGPRQGHLPAHSGLPVRPSVPAFRPGLPARPSGPACLPAGPLQCKSKHPSHTTRQASRAGVLGPMVRPSDRNPAAQAGGAATKTVTVTLAAATLAAVTLAAVTFAAVTFATIGPEPSSPRRSGNPSPRAARSATPHTACRPCRTISSALRPPSDPLHPRLRGPSSTAPWRGGSEAPPTRPAPRQVHVPAHPRERTWGGGEQSIELLPVQSAEY